MPDALFSSQNGLSRKLGRRSLLAALGASAIGFSFSGCAREVERGANGEEKKLNFYNWDTYIGKHTFSWFKDQTGIEVNLTLFANNDELFSKLRAGNPGFDVIMPTNDFVTRMRIADMLEPLDHARIPNFRNIQKSFQTAPFDPGRKYSIPYTWLALGVGYRKSKVDGVPDTWKWMFESDRYKGRISWFNEADDLVRIAAKYLGYSAVGIPDVAFSRIETLLTAQKKNVRVFHEDNGQDLLLAGDVDLVLEYNGDIAQVMAEDDDLAFVIPKEGSLLQSDCLCIPKGAPRPDNAHRFINYLLDAKVGADISSTILYPTPNQAVFDIMPDDYRNNPAIFPPRAELAKCEYSAFEGVERSRLFDEILTRVRAA
jgi:spermidine/putrescine transport system substrate-binding protein